MLEHRRHGRDAMLHAGRAAVPAGRRQADLDRFLFEPENVIVVVGQDGLIAKVTQYPGGGPVLGLSSAPDLDDGVLARVRVAQLKPLPRTSAAGAARALNTVFLGHHTCQSARYRIACGELARRPFVEWG